MGKKMFPPRHLIEAHAPPGQQAKTQERDSSSPSHRKIIQSHKGKATAGVSSRKAASTINCAIGIEVAQKTERLVLAAIGNEVYGAINPCYSFESGNCQWYKGKTHNDKERRFSPLAQAQCKPWKECCSKEHKKSCPDTNKHTLGAGIKKEFMTIVKNF